MKVFLRVDDKLCHGQITYVWIKRLKIDRLIIANDRLIYDDFSKIILNLSKPFGIEQEVVSVDQALRSLSKRNGQENLLILVGNIEDACRIANGSHKISKIVIGAVRNHAGAISCGEHIYLDEEELDWCSNMLHQNIQVVCRYAYEDEETPLSAFMEQHGQPSSL